MRSRNPRTNSLVKGSANSMLNNKKFIFTEHILHVRPSPKYLIRCINLVSLGTVPVKKGPVTPHFIDEEMEAEVREFAQGYSSKCQSQDLNPDMQIPGSYTYYPVASPDHSHSCTGWYAQSSDVIYMCSISFFPHQNYSGTEGGKGTPR